MRGELRIEGLGYVGARRKERPDVSALLSAWLASPEPEDARLARLAAQLSAQLLSPRSIRVELERGAVVLSERLPDRRASAFSRWALGLGSPLRPDGVAPRAATPARRAHAFSHRLRLAGFATPRVLAFAEPKRSRRGWPSLLVTEHFEAPSLRALRDAGGLLDASKRRRWAELLGRSLGRLHGEGLVHGDLHGGHVLLTDGDVLFLGLEKMRASSSRRHRALDLARLELELEDGPGGPYDRGRFLRGYARGSPEPRALRAELVRAVRRVAPRPPGAET